MADEEALFDFVDLFAGIGGFHIALGERWGGLGGRCVLASELDRAARQVYRLNFRMPATGDVRKVIARHAGEAVTPEDSDDDLLIVGTEIPKHDLLAAGFPCQPFSKSGRQMGLEDRTRGTLFFDICEILKARKPRFIVLENVRNIAAHDGGRTWAVMIERLHELGYKVNSTPLVFSPHLLHPDDGGAPQFRERVFILGEHRDHNSHMPLDWEFHIPNQPVGDWDVADWDLKQWLKEHAPLEADPSEYEWDPQVSARYQHAAAWGELLAQLPFPGRIPQPLKVYAWKSKPDLDGLPGWKQRHNIINSAFYLENTDVLERWIRKHRPHEWIKSDQKFEWQAQDADRMTPDDIFQLQIQFRPSGIRVKKPTYTGALVAITQTPFMGWLNRPLTPSEAASLQGVPVHDEADPYLLHPKAPVAFKQLGNGVNAGVVRFLTKALFKHCEFTDYRHGEPFQHSHTREVVDLAWATESAVTDLPPSPMRGRSRLEASRETRAEQPHAEAMHADFDPARSPFEAALRIFALTGRPPDSSRGQKRALLALRDALGVDVPTARTNAALAAAIAGALGVDWDAASFTESSQVNLRGLNALLAAGVRAKRAGSLARLQGAAPAALRGPAWASFNPARSKVEAVTRLAALTNAPREWLGPGGKEHKSALLNLGAALFPNDARIDPSSKTSLGASLAAALDVPWSDRCESTGYTISLIGLNTLLAGAERHLGRLGNELADALRSPEDEGAALVAALLAGLPPHWDGRTSVEWLAANALRGANDNEWQGFYGEEMAKAVLARSLTPRADPPVTRYGNTTFDYALNRVWDIKVHTEVRVLAQDRVPAPDETLLNDAAAIRRCVHEQGLGFVVVSGAGHMDRSGEFVEWHRGFKASHRRGASASSNSGKSRMRKAAFTPTVVEAFWLPNIEALDAAILSGALTVSPQGRQAPRQAGCLGAPRADKLQMRMGVARGSLRVAQQNWKDAGEGPRRA